MATTKTTGSLYSKTGMNPGTSTKAMYTTTNISNIKSALDSVLPPKYQINSVVINVKASFTAGLSAKVYLQFGLGSGDSISQTILEEKQIADTAKSGSETYSRDITQYLKSRTSSDIKTDYGSLLVFCMQSANISKKTYSIDSVTLTVNYDNLYSYTFKDWDGTVLKHFDGILEGNIPMPPKDPTRQSDEYYDYEFSGWYPQPEAITKDMTYTAVYTAILRKINKILIDTAKPKKILIDNQEVKAIYIDTTKVYG